MTTADPARWASLLLQVRRRIETEFGEVVIPLRAEHVPDEAKALLAEAEVLGIGDDGFRDEISRSLPEAYRDELCARVLSIEQSLEEWLARTAPGAQSHERRAFQGLLELVREIVAESSAVGSTSCSPPVAEESFQAILSRARASMRAKS